MANINNMLNNTGSSGLLPQNTKKADDTTALFVSLYLIVLAFFVVMNSISNQDQNKVDAATESVTRAFKNPFEPQSDFVDVTASQDAETPNDEFYDQIRGVFASLIGFEGKFPTSGGTILTVNFSARDLFVEDSADFLPKQQKFLSQLADFLQSGRASDKREIEIVFSTGRRLPTGPDYWQNQTIRRADSFISRLKTLGVSPDSLSVGLTRGQSDQITITFYTRERAEARQRLSHDAPLDMKRGLDD